MPLIGTPQGQHNWWTKGLGGSRRTLRNWTRGWTTAKSVAQEGRKVKPIPPPMPSCFTDRKTSRTDLIGLKPAEHFLFFLLFSPSSFLSFFFYSFFTFLFLLPAFFSLFFILIFVEIASFLSSNLFYSFFLPSFPFLFLSFFIFLFPLSFSHR